MGGNFVNILSIDSKKAADLFKIDRFSKEDSPGGIRTCDQSVNSRPLYR
jgi:hypothetical protein